MATMPPQKPGLSKQDVQTPPGFLAAVRSLLQISDFDLDVAADSTNAVVPFYYDEQTNGLDMPWVVDGWAWCNPPYSKIRPWVERAYEQSQQGAKIAVLVPAAVGSNWWRDWVHAKAHIHLLNGRIRFVGHTAGYPKDLALLLYAQDRPPKYTIWTWPQWMQEQG
jgi:phage N-6-adenine-methyltransferase